MDIDKFISKHKLSADYASVAVRWFFPLFETILNAYDREASPLVLGINGAQGSGKSTLSDLLVSFAEEDMSMRAVSLSIDDFYLTKAERSHLADSVHPLLRTRGVPGTHDIELAKSVIRGLRESSIPLSIPRFDKSVDDRYPEAQWDRIDERPDIIILEGWCVGSSHQRDDELEESVNRLEAEEDTDHIWRNYVNQQLKCEYPELFSLVDVWVMLKAPSFDCVLEWRYEQESKLSHALDRTGVENASLMDKEGVARFIQYYQRITQATLATLPDRVHYLFELDSNRKIRCMKHPVEV